MNTTTTDDPSISYHWNGWSVRFRTDNRSPRPWTVEHEGRRIATCGTADAAKRQALRCIRDDYGQQTAVRWKQFNNAGTQLSTNAGPEPAPAPAPRGYGANEAGQRVLEALADYVAELLRDRGH